jgi:molybdopterin molybdotransferase
MLTLAEAQAKIFSGLKRAVETETLPLNKAAGRFLAQDVSANVANPAFDNSAMDGYALHTADLNPDAAVLPLQGEASCGMAPDELAPGTTMRIFTGAPLPRGADTVEIQENVTVENTNIVFRETVSLNQNIRRQGEDFAEGQLLYKKSLPRVMNWSSQAMRLNRVRFTSPINLSPCYNCKRWGWMQ